MIFFLVKTENQMLETITDMKLLSNSFYRHASSLDLLKGKQGAAVLDVLFPQSQISDFFIFTLRWYPHRRATAIAVPP